MEAGKHANGIMILPFGYPPDQVGLLQGRIINLASNNRLIIYNVECIATKCFIFYQYITD